MKTRDSLIIGAEAPLTKLSKSFPKEIDEKLFCGLDLGIGSCGQALISTSKEKRNIRGFENLPGPISFLGVRAFDIPETREQTGVKLKNPERRAKRLLRRVTARRADRMKKTRRFLMNHGILPADYHWMKDQWRMAHEEAIPWQWRLDALDRMLPSWEWAVILVHYAKRRGFKSARKGDIVSKGSKGGTLDSTRANHAALSAFRTVAEMFDKDERFTLSVGNADGTQQEVKLKRNKDGNYVSMILRDDLLDEIRQVFAAQRKLGNPHASEAIESEYLKILNQQKSMQNPCDLLGSCPFLPSEKRTTSFAPSFELSRALQRLNTLTLVRADGSKQLLSEHILASGGYGAFVSEFGKNKSISWAMLRKFWNIPQGTEFQDVREGMRKTAKDKAPVTTAAAEKADFCNRSSKRGCAEGSYRLRNALGENAWAAALQAGFGEIDQIAFSLAFYEVVEDSETPFTVLGSMAAAAVSPDLIACVREDLLGERPTLHEFKGACGVSAEVSRRLVPQLMLGITYDKAMKAAGFKDHMEASYPFKDITNPVAKSVIREVMKQVVNLIDEAGALPGRIFIELGRNLGKSIDERNDMDRGIRDRTKDKDSNRDEVARLKQCDRSSVSDEDLLRYELYLDQGGYCPYSGDPLPNPELLYDATLQVDHILPRSRSHDNSFQNKVLVFSKANQDKGSRTPYEWLSATPQKWNAFQAYVLSMQTLKRHKKRNLLNETFADKEEKFAERNLNDTRYISKVILSYLEALYEEAGHLPVRDGGKRRVFTRPGAMTSLVRKAWGLENLKKDFSGQRIGDKHHAVDALVCACLAEGDAQWIAKISKAYGNLEKPFASHIAIKNLEKPWDHFRNDVVDALRQITVSRRERCGAGGPLHLETIYRARKDEDGKLVAFKRDSIVGKDQKGKAKPNFNKPEDLEKIAGIHDERSRWLKDALLVWIERGSPTDPENLPRDPQGCVIRKVFSKQRSIQLRPQQQGHVTSGTMVRCDVFSKKGQFHLVPIYNYQLVERTPPMRAIMAAKSENQWTLIDETFRFEFSLWKNSYLEIKFSDGDLNEGYYCGLNRNNGRIAYALANDGGADKDPSGKDLVFSTKSGVASFRKISVDRLGRMFPVKSEKRTWRGAVCI